MFYSIEGRLLFIEPNESEYTMAIKTKDGVAYEIKTTHVTAIKCPQPDQEIELYTYFSVKETGVDLYGFYDKSERDAFKLLITVSGVGPKAALAILSNLTPNRLATSISKGDINSLSAAKGIGVKTASRIILELKDKFKFREDDYVDSVDNGNIDAQNEAVDALLALGYTKPQSKAALRGISEDKSVGELIKIGLKNLQK